MEFWYLKAFLIFIELFWSRRRKEKKIVKKNKFFIYSASIYKTVQVKFVEDDL